MPTTLTRVRLLLLSLAVVFAFVTVAPSALAEGKQGEAVAKILAAESSPTAPVRHRSAKAKPAAKASSKNAKKAKKTAGHVKPAKAKPGKGKASPVRRAGQKLRA